MNYHVIQYVPDHVTSEQVGAGAIVNGAFNFFQNFSTQLNNSYLPYFKQVQHDALTLSTEEVAVQKESVSEMPQGK